MIPMWGKGSKAFRRTEAENKYRHGILKNPPILILDEATSSLDNQSERIVQESLEELSSNRTTFVIAHRLSTIRRAKTILVLTDNGIEEKGSHEDLIRNDGVYASLYNAQFEDTEELEIH